MKWNRKLYLRVRYLGKPTLEELGTKIEFTDTFEIVPKRNK